MVLDLWRSWASGALVAEVEPGVYADMAGIRPIDHHGRHFDVRGPISLPPSEQGYPVIYHAGVSDDVRTLTARTGEAMFTAVTDVDAAQSEVDTVRRRAGAFGRSRDAVRILPGLVTSVGGEPAAAKLDPQGSVEAQFSVFSQVALAWLDGTVGWRRYRRLPGEDVRRMTGRVTTRTADLGAHGTKVAVRAGGRQRSETVTAPLDEPENWIGDEM